MRDQIPVGDSVVDVVERTCSKSLCDSLVWSIRLRVAIACIVINVVTLLFGLFVGCAGNATLRRASHEGDEQAIGTPAISK